MTFNARAAFHRHSVRRLRPASLSAAAPPRPLARRSSYLSNFSRRSATAGGSGVSSTAKLRYDLIRMDSMFMDRSPSVGLSFTEGYPIRRRGGDFPASAPLSRSPPGCAKCI